MRTRLRIRGLVQGVGFRYFVRQAALRHGIAGYVLNRPDGAVELEAEAEDDAIAAFRRTVERGPPLARVDRVESLQPGTMPLAVPFEIRH